MNNLTHSCEIWSDRFSLTNCFICSDMNLLKYSSYKGYENRLTLVLTLNIPMISNFLVQNDI